MKENVFVKRIGSALPYFLCWYFCPSLFDSKKKENFCLNIFIFVWLNNFEARSLALPFYSSVACLASPPLSLRSFPPVRYLSVCVHNFHFPHFVSSASIYFYCVCLFSTLGHLWLDITYISSWIYSLLYFLLKYKAVQLTQTWRNKVSNIYNENISLN